MALRRAARRARPEMDGRAARAETCSLNATQDEKGALG